MPVKKDSEAYQRKLKRCRDAKQLASQKKTLSKPFVQKAIAESKEPVVRRSNKHMREKVHWQSAYKAEVKKVSAPVVNTFAKPRTNFPN